MKTLKKNILPINPKYMDYGRANWYKQSQHLSKYYCFTDASVTQLRKLKYLPLKQFMVLIMPMATIISLLLEI